MPGITAMKVFLLVCPDQDDFDVIYGVYSSRANAEVAQAGTDACADIKELELDTTYVGGI